MLPPSRTVGPARKPRPTSNGVGPLRPGPSSLNARQDDNLGGGAAF